MPNMVQMSVIMELYCLQDLIDLVQHFISNEALLRQASDSAFENYFQTHRWEKIAHKIFHLSHQ